MKCVYANWNDGNPPCCTNDCEGCVWYVDDEVEEDEWMKCVYANWNAGNPPCCTHDCEGCVWYVDDEVEEGET